MQAIALIKTFISFVGMKVAVALNVAAGAQATMAIGSAVIAGSALVAKKAMSLFDMEIAVPDTDTSRQSTVKNTSEPQKIIYGEALVSGPISFIGLGGTDNEDLYQTIVLAGHQVNAITDVYFDDFVITNSQINNGSSAGGVVAQGAFAPQNNVNFVTIYKKLGLPSQTADSMLENQFSNYTSNHRGDGIAYLAMKWTLNEDSAAVWDKYAPSNVKALVQGKKIYDPRLEETAVGTLGQDVTNTNYIAYSDNPALCLADYLTSVSYINAGSFVTNTDYRIEVIGTTDFTAIGASSNTVGLTFTATGAGSGTGKASVPSFGMGVLPSKIDWSAVKTAANGCDATVTVPNGNEKRFTCNGVVFATDTHKKNINKILSSMNGTLVYSNGRYVIRAGIYTAPTVSLNEDDLIGAISVKTSIDRSERVNTVKGLFIDPSQGHKMVEFPVVQLANELARDNYQVMEKETQFPMTNTSYGAQRLAYKIIKAGNEQKVITFPANYSALRITAGDRVQVSLSELNWTNKIFICAGWVFSEDGGIALTLREDSTAAYADPTSYSQVSGTGTITDAFRGVPSPSGLQVESAESKIFLNWVNPGRPTDFNTIEIWASSSNNRANAVKIGETNGTQFTHDASNTAITITVGQTLYYWIRAKKNLGTATDTSTLSGFFPTGATSGTSVTVNAAAVDWDNVANPTIGIDLNNDDSISINLGSSDSTSGQAVAQSGISQDVTITQGGIRMNQGGSIRGGQTSYNSGEGFFLGYDTDKYKLSIRNSTSEALTFDGDDLTITGTVNASAGAFTGDVSTDSKFIAGSGATSATMDGGDQNYKFYAGAASAGASPFKVDAQGTVTADRIIITRPNDPSAVIFDSSQDGLVGIGLSSLSSETDNAVAEVADELTSNTDYTRLIISTTQTVTVKTLFPLGYLPFAINSEEDFPDSITLQLQVASVTNGVPGTFNNVASGSKTFTRRVFSSGAASDDDYYSVYNSGNGWYVKGKDAVDGQFNLVYSRSGVFTPGDVAYRVQVSFVAGSGSGSGNPNTSSSRTLYYTSSTQYFTVDSSGIIRDQAPGSILTGDVILSAASGVRSISWRDSDTQDETFTIEAKPDINESGSNTMFIKYNNGSTSPFAFVGDNGNLLIAGDFYTGLGAITANTASIGGGYGSTGLSIAADGNLSTDGNVIIGGDLLVSGTTTTVNSSELTVKDPNITLNFSTGDSSSTANNAGITIQDAVSATSDASLLWKTASDSFEFSHPVKDLSLTGDLVSDSSIYLRSAGGVAGLYLQDTTGGSTSTAFRLYSDVDSTTVNIDTGGSQTIAAFVNNGNLLITGTIYADGAASNSLQWETGYDYSQIGHLPLAGGALTGNLDIKKTGADTIVDIRGNSDYDPILNLRSDQNAITTEGFQIWYDNSVGDAHLHTTYANDVAAIRFHTATGTDKATNNERFTIQGNGLINAARDIRTAGQIRATGWYNEAASTDFTGPAFEIGVSGSSAYALSYDRDTASYGDMTFNATAFSFVSISDAEIAKFENTNSSAAFVTIAQKNPSANYPYLELQSYSATSTFNRGYLIKNRLNTTTNGASASSLYLYNETGPVEFFPSSDSTNRTTVGTDGSLTVRGTVIGDLLSTENGLIDSTVNNSLQIKGDNKSPFMFRNNSYDNVFSSLPWASGDIFLAFGGYYDGSNWIERSTASTPYLSLLNPNPNGMNWYYSTSFTNRAQTSWNIASDVSLWNEYGAWDGDINTSYNINTGAIAATAAITSSAGTSEFYSLKANTGGMYVFGGGTYTDPGSQMYLHADNSGYGRIAVYDLRFLVGANSSRTVQALRLESDGDAVFGNTINMGHASLSHQTDYSWRGLTILNTGDNNECTVDGKSSDGTQQFVVYGGGQSQGFLHPTSYGWRFKIPLTGNLQRDASYDLFDSGNYPTGLTITGHASGTATFSGSTGTKSLSVTVSQADKTASLGTYVWNASDNPNETSGTTGYAWATGITTSFVQSTDGYPSYGSVIRVKTYPNDGGAAELYFPYNGSYGGNHLRFRFGLYNNQGMTAFRDVIDSSSYHQIKQGDFSADAFKWQGNSAYYFDPNPAVTTALRFADSNIDMRGVLNGSTDNGQIILGAYNGPSGGGGTTQGPAIVWKPNYTGYTKESLKIAGIAKDNYFDMDMVFYTNGNSAETGGNTERFRLTQEGTAYFSAPHVGINTSTVGNTAWGSITNTGQLTISGTNYGVLNMKGSSSTHYAMGSGGSRFYMAYRQGAGHLITIHNDNVGLGYNNTTPSASHAVDINGDLLIDDGSIDITSSATSFDGLTIGSTTQTVHSNAIWYSNTGNFQIWKSGNASGSSWGGNDASNIYSSSGHIYFHPAQTSSQFVVQSDYCLVDQGLRAKSAAGGSYGPMFSANGKYAQASVGHTATQNEGIHWHSNGNDYAIYHTAGNWTASSYQQLKITWPTGIILETQNDGVYDKSYIDVNAAIYADEAIHAPVYYDQSGTSYYLDLSNTGDSIRVAGNIVAYYSDERLKDIEGPIKNALDSVNTLEGFYYTPNKKAQSLGYKKKREVGLSAQAVQLILPEVVTDAAIDPDYLTVDYARLVPLLVESIKELTQKVSALEKKIEDKK